MVNLEGFVPGKRFRRDKMECGVGPLCVAAGKEAWESRLVMKSENVRENRGFSGQTAYAGAGVDTGLTLA